MNRITKKQFDVIKNISNISVVSFKLTNGTLVRMHTYSEVSVLTAMHEIASRSALGYVCLLIKDLPIMEHSNNFDDYLKYLGDDYVW